ncbi:MAG: hypothetical protein QM820_44235 [Minicystis sp.]
MSQWKKIATFAALSLSMALATGCLAPASDETASEPEATAAVDAEGMLADTSADESIGEANQAVFGSFFFRHHPFRPFFLRTFFPFACGCSVPVDLDDFLGFSGCGGCF